MVHARKTILAESRIRAMHGDGYATRVIGMFDEDILWDTPTGGDQTFSEKRNQTVRFGFYGIGCPHPAAECLSAQLNKLVMHYGSKSCLGINLQASLELLVIEMGTSLQPLAEDYDQCHHWVTPSWLKSIWEKARRFDIKVQFA